MAMDALSRYLLTDKPEDVSVEDYKTERELDPVEAQRKAMREASAAAALPAFKPETSKVQGALTGSLLKDQRLRGPEYGRPLSDEDFAAEQARARKLMAEDERDIPINSVPVQRDAAAPTTGVIAPTTGARAAEGAGGDTEEMDRLSSAANWIRAMETAGSAISGKNLRSGIADSLSDRMKQVEALRLKRAERAEEQALETSRFGASNRALLAGYIAQFKDRPDVVEALKAMEPAADTTKPSDFMKGVYGAVTTPATLAGKEAAVPLTEARAKDVGAAADLKKERGTTEAALREPKVRKLGTAADLDEARRKALENQARADIVTSDKEARETKADARAAEAAVTRAMERANKGEDVTNTANNFIALETVAPGFAKGNKPDWLGRFTLQKAMQVPAISNKAAALNSALENFTANIRKTLFGASLTGNEKASFDLIVNRKLTATPEQLAAAVNVLREGAARFAQNHFVTALKFHPNETSDVLRSSAVYGPALKKGGIYADVWQLPGSTAEADGVGTRQQKPMASEGYTTLWNKSQGKWQEVPNEKAEAAKASGRFEE